MLWCYTPIKWQKKLRAGAEYCQTLAAKPQTAKYEMQIQPSYVTDWGPTVQRQSLSLSTSIPNRLYRIPGGYGWWIPPQSSVTRIQGSGLVTPARHALLFPGISDCDPHSLRADDSR